jgi:erythromycin esterase
VSAYLAKVDQRKSQEMEPLFSLMRGSEPGRQHFEYLANVSLTERTRIMHSLIELLGYLWLNENKFVILSSAAEFDQAVWYVRILAEFGDMYRQPMTNRDQVRDYYMADTIERIARRSPETKVVVWAHNLHVAVLQHNMGFRLREKFGVAYYALGSTFDQGGFQSRALGRDMTIGKLTSFGVGEAPAGTIEWYFRQAGIPRFIVNLRGSKAPPPVNSWLQEVHSMRSIGLGYLPHAYMNWLKVNLPTAFDGLAFFETANASHPNPTGNREAWKAQEKNE